MKNSERSKEPDYDRTKVETLRAEISDVTSSKYNLQNTVGTIFVRIYDK